MRAFFWLVLLVVSACNYHRNKVEVTEERLEGETWYAWVDRTVLSPRCVHCHSGGESAPMGVDLSRYEAVMASGAVVPFKPEQSRLYLTVREGSMPKGAPPLTPAQQERLREWIAKGAPETGPGSPEPEPPPRPEPTFAWLSANVFQKSCLPCHGGAAPKGDVDLTGYEALLNSAGLMMRPVDPGSPETSGVYDMVLSDKMPPGPEKLPGDVKEAMREWIAAGAENN